MKHAGPATLRTLAPLLAEIRRDMAGITERKPGTFYRKGQGLLHFHEDPAGFFADLKIDGGWQRFPVNLPRDRATFLSAWKRMFVGLTKAGANAKSDTRR
jgi:hypothetical protein